MADHRRRRFLEQRARLYGYALAISQDGETAGDLVQDCAVRCLSAKRIPGDDSAFKAWLFAILRNLWIDRRRRAALIDEVHCDQSLGTVVPVGAETVLVNAVAVRQAFALLGEAHRDVLALVDVGGFSYRQTAELLDIPLGTVMSRVARARAALGELLRDDKVIDLPTRRARRR